jgi:hypothetical protein
MTLFGAGVTGLPTAYDLLVTDFELHRYVAMEASFANGGQLSASRPGASGDGAEGATRPTRSRLAAGDCRAVGVVRDGGARGHRRERQLE